MTDSATAHVPLDAPVPPERNPMRDPGNRLKLAVFCANVARGTSMSDAETLPKVTWEESQRLAVAADRAGIDGMIPLGRWKYTARGGPIEADRTFEPWVWASALSAITERISMFTTVNMHAVPPARRGAHDVDHRPRLGRALLAERRRGLQRAGVQDARDGGPAARGPLRPRRRVDDRWSAARGPTTSPSTSTVKYIKLHEVISEPKPLQQPAPPIMSAGTERPRQAGSPGATRTSTSSTSPASRRCRRSSRRRRPR